MCLSVRSALIAFLSIPYNPNRKLSKKYLELFFYYVRTTVFKVLNHVDKNNEDQTLDYLKKCSNIDGGFGSYPGYPSSTFETFMACQIYTQLNQSFYTEKMVNFIMSCYREGIFYDESIENGYLERNNRFMAASLGALVLLDNNRRKQRDYRLSKEFIQSIERKGFDIKKTVKYLTSCLNADGGFCSFPGAESHAAMSYCCLISLKILGALSDLDLFGIKKYLIKRQSSAGGLNGRPNKLKDGCYGFWCMASLQIINQTHSLDLKKLKTFLDSCFNKTGYSYGPEQDPDVFHTLYVLLGLELIKPERNEALVFGIYH